MKKRKGTPRAFIGTGATQNLIYLLTSYRGTRLEAEADETDDTVTKMVPFLLEDCHKPDLIDLEGQGIDFTKAVQTQLNALNKQAVYVTNKHAMAASARGG